MSYSLGELILDIVADAKLSDAEKEISRLERQMERDAKQSARERSTAEKQVIRIQNEALKVNRQLARAELKRARETERAVKEMGQAQQAVYAQLGTALTTIGAVGTTAIGALSVAGLKAVGDYELLTKSIQSLIAQEKVHTGTVSNMGDALKMSSKDTQEMLKWLRELAVLSPFSEGDLRRSLQMAMGFRFTSQESKRLVEALTDFGAATGKTNHEFERIILALGQIRAAGKLTGQELRQLTEAGLPVRDVLAKAFGVTTGELQKMISDGLVPAGKAIEAITQSLEKDFGGAAERSADTLTGLTNSLKDLVSINLREFSGPLADLVKGELQQLVTLLQNPAIVQNVRDLGQAFADMVGPPLKALSGLAEWFLKLDASTQKLIISSAGVTTAFSGISGAGLLAANQVTSLVGNMRDLDASSVALTGSTSRLSKVMGGLFLAGGTLAAGIVVINSLTAAYEKLNAEKLRLAGASEKELSVFDPKHLTAAETALKRVADGARSLDDAFKSTGGDAALMTVRKMFDETVKLRDIDGQRLTLQERMTVALEKYISKLQAVQSNPSPSTAYTPAGGGSSGGGNASPEEVARVFETSLTERLTMASDFYAMIGQYEQGYYSSSLGLMNDYLGATDDTFNAYVQNQIDTQTAAYGERLTADLKFYDESKKAQAAFANQIEMRAIQMASIVGQGLGRSMLEGNDVFKSALDQALQMFAQFVTEMLLKSALLTSLGPAGALIGGFFGGGLSAGLGSIFGVRSSPVSVRPSGNVSNITTNNNNSGGNFYITVNANSSSNGRNVANQIADALRTNSSPRLARQLR